MLTGLTIQRRAAESGQIKHVSLELGGKNAMVVLPDVDLAEAVDGAIFGMNFNVCQAQSCGSNSRVLVHESIYDEFVNRLTNQLSTYRVGVAYDETSDLGPLVSRQHLNRVTSFLESGTEAGAELLCGGEHPADVPAGGFYLTPAAFANVNPSMRIAQEEIFGPVISVMRYRDYEQMIELANGVEFGLTASIWTRDLSLAHCVAARLDAGYIWINDSSRHYFGTAVRRNEEQRRRLRGVSR